MRGERLADSSYNDMRMNSFIVTLAERDIIRLTLGQTRKSVERLIPQQGNRVDIRKIHVTRQFFEASGPQGHLFENSKKTFLDTV